MATVAVTVAVTETVAVYYSYSCAGEKLRGL